MFPYLDLAGFRRRSILPPTDVDVVEQRYPGFIASRIALRSSFINSRLRKRYGSTGTQSSLPLGQRPPVLEASGTAPPVVSLDGRPILGDLQIAIQLTTPGALTVAIFAWAKDGGVSPLGSDIAPASWVTGVATAPVVALPGTGMTALFSPGFYSADNLYAAATPVPESVLGWLVVMVTLDVYMRRGTNPQDPGVVMVKEEVDLALADLKEAADSKEGLFDLPASEDLDSAVTTGGPQFYSEASPYVWTDQQAVDGHAQDGQGRGV